MISHEKVILIQLPLIGEYWQWLKVLFLWRIILLDVEGRDPVENVLSQLRRYWEDPTEDSLYFSASVASAVFIFPRDSWPSQHMASDSGSQASYIATTYQVVKQLSCHHRVQT